MSMMAEFFAQRVVSSKTEFKNVPESLKGDVAKILIDRGRGDFVPEEYKVKE